MADAAAGTATRPAEPPVLKLPPSERLMSVDALRGFDMFWIIGADWIVSGLEKISKTGPIEVVSTQLKHKQWEGFAFEDLIFPLFVFIAGVSTVFSLGKSVEQGGEKAAMWRLFKRAVLLFIVGIFYYGGFSKEFKDIRILGVLQRIALCYLFAGLTFCCFRLRGMIAVCVALLVGYWALMSFVPVPGVEGHSFDEGKNLANYIDREYLPLRKHDKTHDPEGLLSTLPAIATCLLGCFAGMLLKNSNVDSRKKVLWLFAAGVAGVALGYAWSVQFPIIKKIWTSSYVLVAGGYSSMLLATFYLIVDVWKKQTWAMPFVWIGTNSITIYLAEQFISFKNIANRFVGGELSRNWFGIYGELITALTAIAITLVFLNFLYRKKIFLRL
jgi:predicted acyltransferase